MSKILLVALPMLFLFLSIAYQTGGNVTAQGQTVQLCANNQNCQLVSGTNTQSNSIFLCTISKAVAFTGGSPCFPNGLVPGLTIQCSTLDGHDCYLAIGCFSSFTSTNIYCDLIAGSKTFQTFGTIASTGNTGVTIGSNTGAPNIFAFGNIGPQGFIAMIAIAVGIAALAGLNFFGSGESSEGIHILFMAGTILGVWAILSIAEGFPSQSPTSFFVLINTLAANFGTGLYVLMTFFVLIGTMLLISRGGV